MPRLTSEEMAKLYEERAKEYREKAIVTRVSKGGREYSKKAKEAEAMAEYYRSKQFYAEHGHPEYAGKYEAPEVPEGYKVKEIKETPEGLQVEFAPLKEPTKGIAETLASFETKPLLSYLGLKPPPKTPIEFVKPRETVRPFAGVAGLIAPAEATVYTVARLTGFETPRPPPTIISLAPGKAVEYGPEYAAGTIMGDVLLSIGIGKGLEKVWKYTPHIVKAPIEKVTSKVGKAIRPITRPIAKRLEPISRRMERMTLWPHEKLAPSIVSIPTPEKVGLKSLEAQQLAWESSLAPRTSLVTVTKVGAKRTVYRFFRGVGYTPMSVTLAKAMSVKEMGGRQALLQVEKPAKARAPAKGAMPYLPKIGTEVAPKIPNVLSTSFGVGLTLGVKAVSKPKRVSKQKRRAIPILIPKLAIYEEPSELMKLKLHLFESVVIKKEAREKGVLLPKLRQPSISKEVLIPELGQPQISIQETKLKQVQMQKQVQQQTQIQFKVSKTSITKLTGKPPKLWTPDFLKAKRRRKRKKKKLKGEWWLKTWPVKRSVFLPEEFELKMEL